MMMLNRERQQHPVFRFPVLRPPLPSPTSQSYDLPKQTKTARKRQALRPAWVALEACQFCLQVLWFFSVPCLAVAVAVSFAATTSGAPHRSIP